MKFEALICPDVESYGAKYRLHNGYKTKIERVSVSLEVITCNDEFTQGCKSNEDIKLLLDNLVITQYHVMEGIDFRDENNYGKRPVN